MRLIDADRLVKRFCAHCTSMGEDGVCREGGNCFDKKIIDHTPTVEAEPLRNALILMVLQYCTDEDGYLWNRCMAAGEAAFRALGVENGDSADKLWARLEGEEKK